MSLPPAPSLASLRTAIARGETTAEHVTRDALQRLHALNGELNAFIDIFDEYAINQAQWIDARLAELRLAGGTPAPQAANDLSPIGPLAGVPIAIKDNICLSWGRTTCASRFLENYHSPYTATAAQLLIDAGAIIVGKTNLDEFSMGSSGEHSAFGPTRNPWDMSRVAGGSSSGSAAAVAAGIVPGALGSDTGGSIRQPASLCGVVGVKPTYGRVSRYGLVAFASGLDQIGPIARTVEDAAILLNVICGFDPLDSTSAEVGVPDFAAHLDEPIANLRIGVPSQARSDANHPAVNEAVDRAIAVYREAGATIVEVDLPHMDEGIAAYYIISPAEASSNLARYDGIRYGRRAELKPGEGLEDLYRRSRAEGFGPEVQRRIMLGTHVLSAGYYDAYYNTALKVRRLIKQDYDAAFAGQGGKGGCHALLMPTAPHPAFRLGEKADDPLALYLEDSYTVGANLAGLPGLSVPMLVASDGEARLPVGVQLIGPALGETTLLRAARTLERAAAPLCLPKW